jgi:hypothetical protein
MYPEALAPRRALGSNGEIIMDRHQQVSEIIDQAKQQRAEYIASAFRTHALPIAVVAAASLMLLQFATAPAADDAITTEVAQLVSTQ